MVPLLRPPTAGVPGGAEAGARPRRRTRGDLPADPDYALSDVEKKQLTFPVLTDAHNQVARAYGLVFALSDVLRSLQTSFGNPVPKFNGDDSWELPMPGTFVLDRNGVVRLSHVDPNYMLRLEPTAILDALRAARS